MSAAELIVRFIFIDICIVGMGTVHAWEKYGDGAAPDIQAVAKGLGGGYEGVRFFLIVGC